MAERLTAEDEAYLKTRGQGVDAPVPPAPVEPAPAESAPAPAVPAADPATPPADPATPAPAAAPAEPQRSSGMVPVGELAQERERRRKAEQAAQTERLERERLAGRVDEIARRFAETQPKPTAPAEVDIDLDPVAALKSERAARKQIEADQARRTEEARATTEQQQQIQALQTRYAAAAREFAQQAPDWNEAYQHFVQTREQAYIALGYADPVERQNLLNRDEIILAARAFNEGANPAERLYAAAGTLGYRKPEPQPVIPPLGVSPSPAAPAPQPVPGAPTMPTEAEKLAALQRGADASRSLGQTGGSAPASSLTLDAMLKMSEDDFAKVPHAAFEKIMMAHYDKLPRQ